MSARRRGISNPKKKNKGKQPIKTRIRWAKFIFYTLLYFVFIVIVGGLIKTKVGEIYYIGSLPLDLQEGLWVLASGIWFLFLLYTGIKAYQG